VVQPGSVSLDEVSFRKKLLGDSIHQIPKELRFSGTEYAELTTIGQVDEDRSGI
jgi:hypothetical protein